MSTWTNIINSGNDYKVFYADAQALNMSGDFCKEYRLFDALTQNSVILDVNDTVSNVGNCRIESLIRNSNNPDTYNNLGNTVLLAARVHADVANPPHYNGVYLLYDGLRDFTICYGWLDTMWSNIQNNTVVTKHIGTTGTVQIRWDVITTTDNAFLLTKLEQWTGSAWTKLVVTGWNIPAATYTSGKLGIGSVNLAMDSPNDSSYFDAVKIFLPA
jgi:hypothetical protein